MGKAAALVMALASIGAVALAYRLPTQRFDDNLARVGEDVPAIGFDLTPAYG